MIANGRLSFPKRQQQLSIAAAQIAVQVDSGRSIERKQEEDVDFADPGMDERDDAGAAMDIEGNADYDETSQF